MTRQIFIIIYYILEWVLQVLESFSDIVNIFISPIMIFISRRSAASILASNGGDTTLEKKWLDFLKFFGNLSFTLQLILAGNVLFYIILQNSLFSYPLDRSIMNLICAFFSFTIPEVLS